MHDHQVEVDDEVFSYVQQHAEPLVDNFNTTIKRLLGLTVKGPGSQPSLSKGQPTPIPGLELPRETPQALRQILEVAYLVSKRGESRTDATRIVARTRHVAPQTVLDKYCRQLDLTAADFDRLLDEPQLTSLRTKLHRKFPEYSGVVDDILSGRHAA